MIRRAPGRLEVRRAGGALGDESADAPEVIRRAHNEFGLAPSVESKAGKIDKSLDLLICIGSSGSNL
jgi:hypothetical protein